jgi:fructokinase
MSDHLPGSRFVVFGEVLFDCFPDGSRVLGGAPFNVAWNLRGLGGEPLLISRIGIDAEGRKVQEVMQHWGMDVTGLQQDEEHPTGRVEVTLEQGQPGFEIVADQAYDHIDAKGAMHSIGQMPPAMIYHGSLIRRAESATALQSMIDATGAPVFLDINLRAPWWQADDLRLSIKRARWLKINDEELRTLQPVLGLPADESLAALAMALARHFDLATLIVTCGGDGAFAIDAQGHIVRQAVTAVPHLVDTVGAGDAFSAMCMLGLARDWPLSDTLERAQHFAARICGIRGATSHDKELYQWT